jgi:hypothetical protein
MGIRGEIFSTKVILQNRTYFFNIKENRMGDLYLNIVESKNKDSGGFERQSVILFADDLQEFLKGFDESLRILEKAEREKRREKTTDKPAYRNKDTEERNTYRKKPAYKDRDFDASDSKRPTYRDTSDGRKPAFRDRDSGASDRKKPAYRDASDGRKPAFRDRDSGASDRKKPAFRGKSDKSFHSRKDEGGRFFQKDKGDNEKPQNRKVVVRKKKF